MEGKPQNQAELKTNKALEVKPKLSTAEKSQPKKPAQSEELPQTAEGMQKKKAKNNAVKRFHVRYSIRSKLIVLLSILVVILMASTAWFLMNQKRLELTRDIYTNSRNFAELTADDIAEMYEVYLAENGFIQFNRVVQSLFRRSEDVQRITLARFSGEVLYDSETEKLQQHLGETRTLESDTKLMERVQAPFPSVNISGSGRVVYLEKDSLGQTFEVNLNGKKIEPIKDENRIGTIVHPVGQKYAVLYQVSYDLLDQRIAKTYRQIGLLLLMGIALGVGIAMIISQRVSKPIKELKEGAQQIADGHFNHRVDVQSKDELGLLASAFNQMAKDLKRSMEAMIYKERVAKELEIAKEIQQSIIPKKVPEIKGIDVAASVDPAAEIGGDCYDFINVNEENTVLYVGDVTGHGVPAGLLVSVANALIYAYRAVNDIRNVLVNVNAILQAKSQPNMFITMAMLNWNITTQKLEYVSAGHEKILQYSMKTNQVSELDAGGIALGMVPDCSKLLKKLPIEMNRGDVIILYSDGIPEAWNARKEQYGMGRLRRVLLDAATGHKSDQENKAPTDVTAEDIRKDIIDDVHTFMGKAPQADDITLMVVKKV